MLFSQRIGKKPKEKPIQIDSIDEELQNGLWSLIYTHIYESVNKCQQPISIHKSFMTNLWLHFFKKPIDELEKYKTEQHLLDLEAHAYFDYDYFHDLVRDWFFNAQWYEIYGFLEFIASHHPLQDSKIFIKTCNKILEKEYSAYRIVDNQVVEITSEVEIKEIEEALQTPLVAVRSHLQTSLSHLSSREKPDYRNSVKESISAVEALARVVCKKPKATLGQLIKILESHVGIHPALKNAFDKLYGYASDEGGVRHSLLEQDAITKSEATFMLTACSAFVNYVVSKAAEKGIKIKPTK